MDNQYINMNQEMDVINGYISDIDVCTFKVGQVAEGAKLYRAVNKINIISVITTVYALVCAFVGRGEHLLSTAPFWGVAAAGVLIILFSFATRKNEDSSSLMLSCVLNAAVVIAAIIFFMILFHFIPVIVMLVNWVYTILVNYQTKRTVWKIASDL